MEDKTKPILPAGPIESQEIRIDVDEPESPSPSFTVPLMGSESPSPRLSHIGYMLSEGHEPRLLLESAGMESCCIYKVPDSLAEVNPNAYTPKIVSIGPYHHGEGHLQMIQEHKPRFMQLFINKSREHGVADDVLHCAVLDMKKEIRKSYSKHLEFGGDQLVSMMILDGIFILTLLLIKSNIIEIDQHMDPIFTSSWIIPSIRIDLLLLENQVPFFLLETLFEKSKIPGKLKNIAFDFFNLSLGYPEEYWKVYENLTPNHLLDLLRKTFLPRSGSETRSSSCRHRCLGSCFYCRRSSDSTSTTRKQGATSRLILSAKKLRLKGIHTRVRSDAGTTTSILDIRLRNNNLYIPMLRMDGFISSFFLNCVAFEQLYNESSSHITSYVVFMGNLLHNEEDADFLSNEKRIIENYFGDEYEVSQFFKTITKAVVFDLEESYLKNVYEGVNDYTSRCYSGLWSGFKHTHFESPWTLMSSAAVVLVILLSVLQATVAVLSYRHDTKKP